MRGYQHVGEDDDKPDFIDIDHQLSRYEQSENWEWVDDETEADADDPLGGVTVADLDSIIDGFDVDVDKKLNKAAKAAAVIAALAAAGQSGTAEGE